MMDIDIAEIRKMFDDWFIREGYPNELYEPLWKAYEQGIMDSPKLPSNDYPL